MDDATIRGVPVPATQPHRSRGAVERNTCFAVFVGLTLVVFAAPLSMLVRFVLQREEYSHILLVPAVSVFLLFRDRRRIFSDVQTCWRLGLGVLLTGVLFGWLGYKYAVSPSDNDRLFTAIFSLVVIWIGGFILCYGLRVVHAGLFPVLFLFMAVPLPDLLLNAVVFWLQSGSAELSDALFKLAGVPFFRTDFLFALPGVTIEIAKECSGIRSSLALLITSLLAGYVCLQSAWTRMILILVTFPLLIVKNGIRIVTLSTLAIYADPSFLTGKLHSQGGFVFFLLALAILAPVLWFLQRSEVDH